MIVFDIETSGPDPQSHGMLSLGAVEYDTGATFYGECRLEPHQKFDEFALKWNGFKQEELYSKDKQSQVQLYQKFADWALFNGTMLAGQHVGSFDVQFLKKVHLKQKKIKEFPFQFKYVDLHSVAFAILGKSMGLDQICKELGIEPEPSPHNALLGAQKEYECFKILLNR